MTLAENIKSLGWVAERSNATVLKTVEVARLPGVRIPPHPPRKLNAQIFWAFILYIQQNILYACSCSMVLISRFFVDIY